MDKRSIFSFGALLQFALMLLLVPLRWVLASILAATIHELGHYAAVRLSGGTVRSFSIRAGSACMMTTELSVAKQILCLLAGPLAGMTLLLLSEQFPMTAICALIQSLYNLLPVYPLDGGKLIRCICEHFGITSQRMIRTEVLIVLALTGIFIYVTILLRTSVFLFPCVCIWLTRVLYSKRPCKAQGYWI